HPFEHSGTSGRLSVMADETKHGIVLDPRVLAAGGAVALIGVAILGAFVWMVPKGAEREIKAACSGLHPATPEELRKEHPMLCTNGTCKYPLPAPDFAAVDNNGKPVKLSSFHGKVLLLNFWASWCG